MTELWVNVSRLWTISKAPPVLWSVQTAVVKILHTKWIWTLVLVLTLLEAGKANIWVIINLNLGESRRSPSCWVFT